MIKAEKNSELGRDIKGRHKGSSKALAETFKARKKSGMALSRRW
jgi:hypothetical protein